MKDPDRFLSALSRAVARRAAPLERLRAELTALLEGFTGHRGSRPSDYLATGNARAAYLASIGLPNAARAHFVLRRSGAGLRAGEHGLDFGAGPGTSALALAALSDPDSEILLVDKSADALEDARQLFAELFPNGPRVSTLRQDYSAGTGALPPGPFRTVIAGHVLNELLPRRGRAPGDALLLAEALAGATGPEGTLVLVEPAQRIPSLALSKVRAALIRGGLQPVGPCTHAGPCPVLARGAKDWCVIDVPWKRPAPVEEADRILNTDRRRLAVSYLALSRAARPAGASEVEVLSGLMTVEDGALLYLCSDKGRLVARFPRRPKKPFPRGTRLLLPKNATPDGRDRTGAPLYRLAPEDLRPPRRGSP